MGKKVESVASNAVSDALTTQLAKQPWRRYEKETGKHYLSLLIGGLKKRQKQIKARSGRDR